MKSQPDSNRITQRDKTYPVAVQQGRDNPLVIPIPLRPAATEPVEKPHPVYPVATRQRRAVNTKQQQFTIVLSDTPGHDVPTIIRLRAFLKAAIRSYGLKCVRCEPTPGDEGDGDEKVEQTR